MFALIPKNAVDNWYLIVVIFCTILCFWYLGSFFILQEQKYRDKFEWVIKERLKGNLDFLYDLKPNNKDMNLNNKNVIY